MTTKLKCCGTGLKQGVLQDARVDKIFVPLEQQPRVSLLIGIINVALTTHILMDLTQSPTLISG